MRRALYIDVLRGIAILTVLVHHLPQAWADTLPQPWAQVATMGGRGVDLFFVLSGFLISTTALARADKNAANWAQAISYASLRVARIWPLYFLLLAFYVLAGRFYRPQVGETVQQIARCYMTFTSNDCPQAHLELGILWSLAIEEQFYLVVGILITFASRNRQTLSAAFIGLSVAAIAVAVRTRYDLVHLAQDGMLPQNLFIFRLYHSTLARIDQLAIGALAAVGASYANQTFLRHATPFPRTLTWGGIASLLACMIYFPHRAIVEFTFLGILFAAVILWCQRPELLGTAGSKADGSHHILTRFLARTGTLSFGLYMLHPITRHMIARAMHRTGLFPTAWTTLIFCVTWFVATWILAEVSFRLLEGPLLRMTRAWAHSLSDYSLDLSIKRDGLTDQDDGSVAHLPRASQARVQSGV